MAANTAPISTFRPVRLGTKMVARDVTAHAVNHQSKHPDHQSTSVVLDPNNPNRANTTRMLRLASKERLLSLAALCTTYTHSTRSTLLSTVTSPTKMSMLLLVAPDHQLNLTTPTSPPSLNAASTLAGTDRAEATQPCLDTVVPTVLPSSVRT